MREIAKQYPRRRRAYTWRRTYRVRLCQPAPLTPSRRGAARRRRPCDAPSRRGAWSCGSCAQCLLNDRLRKHRLDGFKQALEPITTSAEHLVVPSGCPEHLVLFRLVARSLSYANPIAATTSGEIMAKLERARFSTEKRTQGQRAEAIPIRRGVSSSGSESGIPAGCLGEPRESCSDFRSSQRFTCA